jgi:hypothetical protein
MLYLSPGLASTVHLTLSEALPPSGNTGLAYRLEAQARWGDAIWAIVLLPQDDLSLVPWRYNRFEIPALSTIGLAPGQYSFAVWLVPVGATGIPPGSPLLEVGLLQVL